MKQTLHSSIWSIRDLRLVLPARAISYAGDSIALVALMLRVSDAGGPGAITALLLAFALPTVVMIPFAGRIVDGFDSRAVLVCASLLQAAAGVGLAFSHGLAPTLAFVCALQFGQAVAGPAWGALVPRIVGDDLVGKAVGTGQALAGVAMLAGSALGGVLVGWQGDRVALLVDASTFAGLAVVARLVRTRRRPVAGAAGRQGGVMIGLQSLFADQLLRILVPGLWIFVVVGEALNVVEVFLITDEIGLGPTGYGAVVAAQGAGAIWGSLAAGALRSDTARSYAVLAGTVGIGGACVLMGVAPGVVALVVGAVAVGLAGGMLNAATSTLIVTRSVEVVRGRVIAAMTGVTRAFSLLALLLGGLVGAGLGPRATFVLGGLACVLTGLVIAVLVALGSRQMGKDSAEEVLSH